MRLPYPSLRHGLAGAALLLAVPASAQVQDTDTPTDDRQPTVQPSGDSYHAPSSRRSAASPSNARRAGGAAPAPYDKGGPLARLGSTLRGLAAEREEQARRGARLAEDYVDVEVLAMSRGDLGALRAALAQLGFEESARASGAVSGRLPVSALGGLADIPSLRSAFALHYVVHGKTDAYVSPVSSRRARVGAVDGQSSEALRADIVRERFGVTGAGVCIGMLSDSYNNCAMLNADDDPTNDCVTTAADDVASGDLPAGIEVLDDFDGTQSDEGRAMMQLAYDIAPGVDFKFHTAFGGNTRFSKGVILLQQAGCDVLVDDVSNAIEPFFQDGVIAQAADYVVSQGASYFSSAGNADDASYESPYRGSGVEGNIGKRRIGELHDFDPGPDVDPYQEVFMFPGETLRFVFQYDEPSVIASDLVSDFPELIGGAVVGPSSDYDVVVLDGPSTEATILAESVNSNPDFGAPFEFIEYTAEGFEIVYVAIGKFSGEDRFLKYIDFGGTFPIQFAEYVVPGTSTTFGHSNAAGAFATGAAAWFNTSFYNEFVDEFTSVFGPAAVAGFTSYGGTPILLDTDGNRLASPVERMKPDAVSTDGDNNTFFGFDSGVDDDDLPNFFGTSAAAPNASAIAALALEAVGGPDRVTPEAIYSALERTAADLTTIGTINPGAAPGFDDRTGNGFIQADFAVADLLGIEPEACSADLALSFDFNGDGVVDGTDFEVDGANGPETFLGDDFLELAAVSNDTASDIVDLSGCTFVAFDPFSERVTFAAQADGVIGARQELVFAARPGFADVQIPDGSLPDGPGAFALVEGDFAVGASVRDVLGSVVAAVVYRDNENVVGTRGGGATAARTATSAGAWLADALAEVRGGAVVAGSVDLTLTAAPNPVRGRLAIAFGTEAAAPVRASVYDVLGREVAVLADRSFETGRHELSLDTAAMPAGVYVVRVASGGEIQTTPVTVVR